MPSGLAALLDDVASITKMAAASLDDVGAAAKVAASSLDDVGAAASKAGAKAAGVVVDDAAVTPRYITGFTPARELPIIWAIAKGSLRNKLLVLLPIALLLSAFLPWAITPLLMLGGAYLCFEGAEKVIEWLGGAKHGEDVTGPIEDVAAFEKERVSGAIRTDFILSAEIMAIALGEVASEPLLERGGILAVVAIGITALVYGAVGLIVKMDDIGLHLAQRDNGASRAVGRGLLVAMPVLMRALSIIGTAAMVWVGGGIILHGTEELGFGQLAHLFHDLAQAAGSALPFAEGAAAWLVNALFAGVVGLILGALIAVVVHGLSRTRGAAH